MTTARTGAGAGAAAPAPAHTPGAAPDPAPPRPAPRLPAHGRASPASWRSSGRPCARASRARPGGCEGSEPSRSPPAWSSGWSPGSRSASADGALTRAGANTDQLVRVQAIQNHVIQADADATNAFLVGGLEPPAQRADYTDAITSASKLIAEAAQNQPADGPALGALNEALVSYATEIEQARANNRQALPIGAQYLKDASADLRADALPALKNLVDANNQRVEEEFDNARTAAIWLGVAGFLTLVLLVLGLVWLARRTRRYVNAPLAAAAAIVLVTLILGAIGLVGIGSKVDSVHDGVYAATLSTAQARIAGFDAKSNESLTLIARGSGSAFEEAWQGSDAVVQRELANLSSNDASASLDPLPWDDYASVHEQIRKLDDAGNWDGAVQLATGTGSKSGNATFASFDTSSGEQLDSLGRDTASQLDDAGGWLPFAAALGLIAGIIAALCAWWGVALRLEEYR